MFIHFHPFSMSQTIQKSPVVGLQSDSWWVDSTWLNCDPYCDPCRSIGRLIGAATSSIWCNIWCRPVGLADQRLSLRTCPQVVPLGASTCPRWLGGWWPCARIAPRMTWSLVESGRCSRKKMRVKHWDSGSWWDTFCRLTMRFSEAQIQRDFIAEGSIHMGLSENMVYSQL